VVALAVLAVWGEHAVEAGEVEPWTRDQGRDACEEVEWIEDDMGGAIAERPLELVNDLPALVGRETLIGNCWPGNVSTEFLELVTLAGLAAGSRQFAWRTA